jgi:PAS domain S-box-containing protein
VKSEGLELEADGSESTLVVTGNAEAEQRDLALVAVERTRMPMVVSDPRRPDNPIVMANAAFLQLTGYTADEIIGRNCRFLQGPGTDRAIVARLREAIANEREIEVELLNYREDGSSFSNTILVSPVHDADGKLVYFFASQKDVTARRRATELELVEHRLLKEVDHRAKNALALVQSIVRLTQADDLKSYSLSIEGRVDAIARAHQLLADANWTDLPIATLIAGAIESSATDRIEFSGPPVLVSPAKVQPLSLLIHEMLDNAAKHGALSRIAGKVMICWKIDVDRGEVTIEVEERGGPAPNDNPRAGLGQQLIDRIVKHQLGGSAVFAYQQGGLRSTLTMATG